MDYFWTNTIWYIALGVLTILQIAYALYRTERPKQLIAFYFTISGVGFVGEANLLMFFKAYNYYPMIFPGSTIHDSLAGNLFSQFLLAATALLAVVLNLNYRYHVLFACLYGLIEELFLLLGIYQHNWYQTWMSVVFLVIYFQIVKILYIKLNKGLTPALYYLYLFLGLWPLHFATTVWPFMITGKVMFYMYLFSDPLNNSTFLMIFDYLTLFSAMLGIYFKLNLLWKPVGIIALYIFQYIQYMFQWLYVEQGWFFVYTSIEIFCMYVYLYILDRLYEQKSAKTS